MNTDFRISVEFTTHPKIRELRRRLGPEAVLCLLEIYAHCATRSIEGFLPGEVDAVERLAQWRGTQGELVATLLDLRLLDQLDEELRVHDWAEHQPYAIHAGERKERARQAGRQSVEKRRKQFGTAQPPGGRQDGPDDTRSNRQFDKDRTGSSNKIELPALAPAPAPAQRGDLPAPQPPHTDGDSPRSNRPFDLVTPLRRPKGGA